MKENKVRIGIAGDARQDEFLKYCMECKFVNGAEVVGLFSDCEITNHSINNDYKLFDSYQELLDTCDAVYLAPHPRKRYEMVKKALFHGKHVLCKAPTSINGEQCKELNELAEENGLILMDAIKTAYSTAYNRLRLLVKSGKIGKVMSISATCTSLAEGKDKGDFRHHWNTIDSWGPIAMLPVFQMLGTDYNDVRYICSKDAQRPDLDAFLEMCFIYPSATANIKLGNGVKSEGDLVISGTKGYVYVPAPWWKTDYFEIRYEDPSNNSRFFYQLEGEGIRFELVIFVRSIKERKYLSDTYLEKKTAECIGKTISNYYGGKDVIKLNNYKIIQS